MSMSPRTFVFGAALAAGIALTAAVAWRMSGDPAGDSGGRRPPPLPAMPGAVNPAGATRFVIADPWEQDQTAAVDVRWTVADPSGVLPQALRLDYAESYVQHWETVQAGKVMHCRREYGTRRLILPPPKPGEDFAEPFDLAGMTVFFDRHTQDLVASTAEGDQDPSLLAALCPEPPSLAVVPDRADVEVGEHWPLRTAPLLGFTPGTGIALALTGDCAAEDILFAENRRWLRIRLTAAGTLKADGKEWALRGGGEAKADLEIGRVTLVTLSGGVTGPGVGEARPTWSLTVTIGHGGPRKR